MIGYNQLVSHDCSFGGGGGGGGRHAGFSKCLDLTGCSPALRTKADKRARGLGGPKKRGVSDEPYMAAEPLD